MNKDPVIFIKHILECIEIIENYAKKITKEKLIEDIKLQDAIIRRIEIIGETAKNLPNDFKDKYPEVGWSEIIRTRDKIIHHYFGIDLEVIWSIIQRDLPDLKRKLKLILEKESSNQQLTLRS